MKDSFIYHFYFRIKNSEYQIKLKQIQAYFSELDSVILLLCQIKKITRLVNLFCFLDNLINMIFHQVFGILRVSLIQIFHFIFSQYEFKKIIFLNDYFLIFVIKQNFINFLLFNYSLRLNFSVYHSMSLILKSFILNVRFTVSISNFKFNLCLKILSYEIVCRQIYQ